MAAVFILLDDAGQLIGTLGLQVEDGLCLGEGKKFEASLDALEKVIPIKRKRGDMVFSGRELSQGKNMIITLRQTKFLDGAQPIPLTKERNQNRTALQTPGEATSYRSLTQKLAWLARTSAPGVAFEVSEAQQLVPEATVQHIVDLDSASLDLFKYGWRL